MELPERDDDIDADGKTTAEAQRGLAEFTRVPLDTRQAVPAGTVVSTHCETHDA